MTDDVGLLKIRILTWASLILYVLNMYKLTHRQQCLSSITIHDAGSRSRQRVLEYGVASGRVAGCPVTHCKCRFCSLPQR